MSTDNQHQIKYFILPHSSNYSVVLADTDEEYIVHHYEYLNNAFDAIVLREESRCYGISYSIKYIFKVEGRDLVVVSCVDKNGDKEETEHPSGFTYIRIPQIPEQKEKWTYQFDGRKVNCISTLKNEIINGTSCQTLHVTRKFIYRDNDFKINVRLDELYLEGKGLKSRKEKTPML